MNKPSAPGLYQAKEIVFGLGGTMSHEPVRTVEVVGGIDNPRHHALLVKTGGTNPKYKSLDCYEWHAEVAMDRQELFNHLRTLIKVASECDDLETVHKLLKEMSALVDKALPRRKKAATSN